MLPQSAGGCFAKNSWKLTWGESGATLIKFLNLHKIPGLLRNCDGGHRGFVVTPVTGMPNNDIKIRFYITEHN